jgi:dolichyl-phosphate beta-glucosyltransferase
MFDFSVVIPAYNSAAFVVGSIESLLKFLDASPLRSYEIIVVDDGSTDGTAKLVRDRFPSIEVVEHPSNRGKGAAVRTGMLASRGRFRFFLDVDVPYDLSAMHDMLRYLDLKEFDVAIGTRNAADVRRSGARPSGVRRAASYLFMQLVSRIVVTGVRDTQCGFKAFRADAAEILFADSTVDGFAFDVEILYYAFKRDMDVKRVPVRLVTSERSSVSLLRHGPRMLWDVLNIPLRYHFGGGVQRTMSKAGAAQ